MNHPENVKPSWIRQTKERLKYEVTRPLGIMAQAWLLRVANQRRAR